MTPKDPHADADKPPVDSTTWAVDAPPRGPTDSGTWAADEAAQGPAGSGTWAVEAAPRGPGDSGTWAGDEPVMVAGDSCTVLGGGHELSLDPTAGLDREIPGRYAAADLQGRLCPDGEPALIGLSRVDTLRAICPSYPR